MKCNVCGFEEKHGVKTQEGFTCVRDFSNPYLWMIPRIQCDYTLGKIPLDERPNKFAKTPSNYSAILTKKTKKRMNIDLLKFKGEQRTL